MRHIQLIGLLLLTACGDGGTAPTSPPKPPTPVATSITLSATSLSFASIGATQQLSATVKDQNGANMSGASVSWATSSASVATVSSSGLVTSVANGTATATATSGSSNGTAAVTVAQAAASIVLSDTLLSFSAPGDTIRLTVTVTDDNGHEMGDATVTWTTSDSELATVSSDGLVTAIAAGTADITATSGSITAKAVAGIIDLCGNAIGNGAEIISGPTGPSGADNDRVFRSLAIGPSNPDIVYLGTERNGIVKTTDGGTTWERLRYGLRHAPSDAGLAYPEVWDIAVSPHDPSLVIASTLDSPGPVVGNHPSAQGGVYRSEDGGATWKRSNCGLTNARAVSVRFDQSDPDIVVLGIEGGEASSSDLAGQYFPGALLRSEDRGHTWETTTTPTNADRNGYWHLRAHPNNDFITFGFNYQDTGENLGFLSSTDGGQSWTQFAPSLRDLLITAFDVSADKQTIYAGQRDGNVYRSLDGGVTWVTIPPNIRGDKALRVSPADPNLVLFSSSSNTLYRTTNGFTTTETVLTAADRVHDIEFAPSDPNIVYAATKGYSVYRSYDGGASFTLLVNLRTDGIIN